jgi:hypothetical protein
MNHSRDLETEYGWDSNLILIALFTLHLKPNFMLDCLYRFRRNGEEFHANANAPEAIADFAPSLNYDPRTRKPESQFQDSAFRIIIAGVNEHAVRAKVGRPNANIFLETFVDHGQFTELRMAGIPSRLRARLVLFSIHD